MRGLCCSFLLCDLNSITSSPMNWLTKEAHQQPILFRLILPTFVTVIIYKDNFFQEYIWRRLKNTMNSSQKRWPSLIIKSYHNRGFWQAIIIIFLLSASVKGEITFSTSAKAFINFQEKFSNPLVCWLLTASKNTERTLKEMHVCGKLYKKTFGSCSCRGSISSIMNKILQTTKRSKKKNNRRYSGLVYL